MSGVGRRIILGLLCCIVAPNMAHAVGKQSVRDDRESGKKIRVSASRFHKSRVAMIVSAIVVFGLFYGCSTSRRADKADTAAGRLGYEGCRLSKPLTMAEVMGKDMSGGYERSRPHPDWDELIQKYASGDVIYFIDCRRVDPSRIAAGTSLYALVRDGVIIARALDTTLE
jgi:hypothetical protein